MALSTFVVGIFHQHNGKIDDITLEVGGKNKNTRNTRSKIQCSKQHSILQNKRDDNAGIRTPKERQSISCMAGMAEESGEGDEGEENIIKTKEKISAC